MQKFSKRDYERRDEIKTNLTAAWNKMREEWSMVSAAVEAYNVFVAEYNEALGEATGWAEDCGNAIEEYISNKSEKWQDGERGQAFAEWRDEFAYASFDNIEPLNIDDFEPGEEIDAIETLNGFSEEPQG